MKPSNYKAFPWGSIAGKSETETVARNIMVILSRTGNEWRKISFEEYVKERNKDGNFSTSELKHFDIAIDYCISADRADIFCSSWCNLKR